MLLSFTHNTKGMTVKTLTKAIIAAVAVFTWLASSAIAENIPLTTYGSTMMAPVHINGVITLNFVLDTGASTVILTEDVIGTLLRAGSLQKSDFIASQTYTLANGTQHTGAQVVLRTLKLGTRVFTNVVAGVVPAGGNLLLGQNILGNLGVWSIDNHRQILIIGKLQKATSTFPSFLIEPEDSPHITPLSGWVLLRTNVLSIVYPA